MIQGEFNMQMKKRKLLAASAACALLMQTAAMLPASAADDYIFSDGFESGEGGWEGRGGATVKTTASEPYAGSGALSVTGRSDSWHGAQKDISSVCTAGETYCFSVCARYDSGPSSVTFMLSLVYKDSAGETTYAHLAEEETMSGFYVQLVKIRLRCPPVRPIRSFMSKRSPAAPRLRSTKRSAHRRGHSSTARSR